MIWSYRAVKNPAARKKWLTFILVIVAFVFGYGAYRVAIGDNAIRIALLLTIFGLQCGREQANYKAEQKGFIWRKNALFRQIGGFERSGEMVKEKIEIVGVWKL
ncbi:MAG: hypothetical protein PWQ22_1377 [Archaeoglobaceae archaeon]|nr:hypothetical protein [Archaeoglobaceae archaeon]